MSLKIRLARGGAKKRPFYRMVITESTAPRDGKFIERVGSYNPLLEKENNERLVVMEDRIKYWISVGAKSTNKVSKLLAEIGVIPEFKPSSTPKKSAPKKKAQERMKSKVSTSVE